jgi:hypothetical protein
MCRAVIQEKCDGGGLSVEVLHVNNSYSECPSLRVKLKRLGAITPAEILGVVHVEQACTVAMQID